MTEIKSKSLILQDFMLQQLEIIFRIFFFLMAGGSSSEYK